ncbi:MAG: MBL fold metallo-hydrolase [Chlorobi bacterium]|nr:MBL fold metallo-hydrolase [Chlorobiota bacterium]MCI0714786.1 MBL fold metallo-hydrolase [Chlorobiota bacterium]
MKVIILGSGTSQGVPIVGCKCAACTSTNPKDKRLRVSAYIEAEIPKENDKYLRLLIDTSPDFRQQMLINNVVDIDAILFTHYHIDHIMGLDDIRQINQLHKKTVDVYANGETLERIKQTFSYIFDKNTYRGGGIPKINVKEIGLDKFSISGVEITPIEYRHGPATVYGFRIGDFAYMTDCNKIPEKEYEKLKNLKVLVLDALRYRPHPTHFSIDEAIEASQKIGAAQTYFTHITHDVIHDKANQRLPKGIELAYDRLAFEI